VEHAQVVGAAANDVERPSSNVKIRPQNQLTALTFSRRCGDVLGGHEDAK
jgi:hypothetical protein